MSAESLEHALLDRLVSGTVRQEEKITWDAVVTWPPVDKGHAVSNIVIGLVGEIRMARLRTDGELAKIFGDLSLAGWDGNTEDEFFSDLRALSEELQKVLPDDEWMKYFEDMSFG